MFNDCNWSYAVFDYVVLCGRGVAMGVNYFDENFCFVSRNGLTG